MRCGGITAGRQQWHNRSIIAPDVFKAAKRVAVNLSYDVIFGNPRFDTRKQAINDFF